MPPDLAAPLHPARSGDHPIILGLIEEYYACDQIAFDRGSISAGLETLLRDPSIGYVFLIRHGTELAGYLICTHAFDLEFAGRIGVVTDVYLRPGHRRQALGTKAFESLFDFACRLGLKAIQLQPECRNAAARAFYTKLGFTAADRIPMTRNVRAGHSA